MLIQNLERPSHGQVCQADPLKELSNLAYVLILIITFPFIYVHYIVPEAPWGSALFNKLPDKYMRVEHCNFYCPTVMFTVHCCTS